MPRPSNPEVRSRLLTAGRQMVHSQGFNGCGVQDITQAAGVPKGSFYNYFDSKESLAVELLDAYWETLIDRYGPILYDARVEPLERIRNFFAGLADFHAESGYALGCLIGNLSLELANGSEAVRAKVLQLLNDWEQLIGACLREAQKRNELDATHDAGEVAKLLVEAFEGATLRAKAERDGAAFVRFERLVLPGLLE